MLNHLDELFDHNFDVVILNETWLCSNIADSLVGFDGYKMLRLDRQART